jgi:hypothetical protein
MEKREEQWREKRRTFEESKKGNGTSKSDYEAVNKESEEKGGGELVNHDDGTEKDPPSLINGYEKSIGNREQTKEGSE